MKPQITPNPTRKTDVCCLDTRLPPDRPEPRRFLWTRRWIAGFMVWSLFQEPAHVRVPGAANVTRRQMADQLRAARRFLRESVLPRRIAGRAGTPPHHTRR